MGTRIVATVIAPHLACWGQGEADREGAPATLAIRGRGDLPAVQLDELLRQREAKAGPLVPVREGGVKLDKRLKELR